MKDILTVIWNFLFRIRDTWEFNRSTFFLFVATFSLVGCAMFGSNTSSGKRTLDIPLVVSSGESSTGEQFRELTGSQAGNDNQSGQKIGRGLNKASVPKAVAAKNSSIQIDPESVIKWQNFFKSPPSVKDRKKIEIRLRGWQNPQSSRDLLVKGRNEVALGQFARAEASFRESLRKDEEQMEGLLELAMLYLRTRHLDRAFEFLEQLRDGISLSESPKLSFVFRYRYTLALAYLARGDKKNGHQVLTDLIALDETFTPGYVALASSYVKDGKFSIARFIAMRGLDRGREAPGLCNVLGVISQGVGNSEAAEKWYNKALSLSPTFTSALVNRSNMHIKRFSYEEAADDLTKALLYDPQSVEALVSMSIVEKKVGKFRSSRELLEKALDLDPENSIARFNLGVLMVESLHKPNEAIRLFFEVVQSSRNGEKIRDIARNYINDIKGSRESY